VKKKLAILTCVWKRPELTETVLSSYRALREDLHEQLELILLAVGSEGEVSKTLCERHDFEYLEYPNSPLSHKWNAGVQSARNHDPDGLVIVGSDDLINGSLLRAWAAKLEEGFDFCGIRDLYVLDLSTLMLGYWGGYEHSAGKADRAGEPIGCGRCFSRDLLDKMEWNLWPEEPRLDEGLDELCLRHVGKKGFMPSSWLLEEAGSMALDIKSGTNITSFDKFEFQRKWKGEEALDFLGETLAEGTVGYLLRLRKDRKW
jgi:hypothetical protein